MNLFMLATSRYDGTVGLVWFGRPEIPAAEYAPLLAALAAQSPSGLVTELAGSDPEAAVRTLREKHVATVVIASHSMESKAGVAAQDFTFSRAVDLNISSLVLISGFLQRKQRPGLVKCASLALIKPQRSLHYPLGHLEDGVHDCSRDMTAVAFPVPVLTVGGELDGLVRIGRIAEAAYTQRSESDRFPVVLIEEMTHSAVLSNATIPGDVPAVITHANRSEIRANVAKAFGTFVNANNAIITTLRAHTYDCHYARSHAHSTLQVRRFTTRTHSLTAKMTVTAAVAITMILALAITTQLLTHSHLTHSLTHSPIN